MNFCLLLLLSAISSALAAGWSYDESEPYGPSNWKKVAPECGESRQSPININWYSAQRVYFAPPVFIDGSRKRPSSIVYKNDGHGFSLSFKYPDDKQSTITGGPLGSQKYIFYNLHIHWKSEHTVGGLFYEAEAHLVHYNSKYDNITEALGNSDGLAVLGLFLRETPWANWYQPVRPFISEIQKVYEPKSTSVRTENLFSLHDILLTQYFDVWSYDGSLTTPTCNEAVTWMVNKIPAYINPAEMAVLKKIKDDAGVPIVNNNRPVQPMNGRVLYSY